MSALRFRYQTSEFGAHDIHFRSLRDRQQFDDADGAADALGISSASWPLFGMVWPSGEVLAQLMASYDIDGRRVLEIGCGVGLASLVLNARMADITATDIHPAAEAFLKHNIALNNGRPIPFLRTAWEDEQNDLYGIFDLIIGSDLLYERQHSATLSHFIEHYAKPTCEVLMVEAGRGYGGKFTRDMASLGFSQKLLTAIAPSTDADNYRGKIHRFRRVAVPAAAPDIPVKDH